MQQRTFTGQTRSACSEAMPNEQWKCSTRRWRPRSVTNAQRDLSARAEREAAKARRESPALRRFSRRERKTTPTQTRYAHTQQARLGEKGHGAQVKPRHPALLIERSAFLAAVCTVPGPMAEEEGESRKAPHWLARRPPRQWRRRGERTVFVRWKRSSTLKEVSLRAAADGVPGRVPPDHSVDARCFRAPPRDSASPPTPEEATGSAASVTAVGTSRHGPARA